MHSLVVNLKNVLITLQPLRFGMPFLHRFMSAIKVCDQGNIWFFSEKSSNKNKSLAADKHVQLFFSHPGKSSYLVVGNQGALKV